MRQQLYELFSTTATSVSFEELVVRVLVSLVMGLVVFASYWLSHAGTIYSKKFNVGLVALTVLTGTVMCVISNNLSLSLGMVGALSIVRFRTAIKDPRDTTYIFWAIICGICCGVGQYLPCAVGSAAVFLILLVLGRVRNDTRMLLVIRAPREQELQIEGLVYRYFDGRATKRVENTTEGTVEFMFELSRGELERASRQADSSITDALYALGGVQYVNLVTQSDEIGS